MNSPSSNTNEKYCRICGSLMTEGESLRQDCGGDCLMCMAEVGDPDCLEAAFKLLRADWTRLRGIVDEVHAWAVCGVIAMPQDMAQNLPRIVEITAPVETSHTNGGDSLTNSWEGFAGFEEASTGGGYVAYFRVVGPVRVMVTCSKDETRLPRENDKVDVGFFHRVTGVLSRNRRNFRRRSG